MITQSIFLDKMLVFSNKIHLNILLSFSFVLNTVADCPYGEYSYVGGCADCNSYMVNTNRENKLSNYGYTTYTLNAPNPDSCVAAVLDPNTDLILTGIMSCFIFILLIYSLIIIFRSTNKILHFLTIRIFFSMLMFIDIIVISVMLNNYPYHLNTEYKITLTDPIIIIISIITCILCFITFMVWIIASCYQSTELVDNNLYYFNFSNLISDLAVLLFVGYFYFFRYTIKIPIQDNQGKILNYDVLRPELRYSVSYISTMVFAGLSLFFGFVYVNINAYQHCQSFLSSSSS